MGENWLYEDSDDETNRALERLGYTVKPKENTNMMEKLFNRDALMNSFFRKVDNTVWDLSTGKIGFRTNEGIATLSSEGEFIDVNPVEQFGIPVPSYATKTSLDKVSKGDFIYGSTAASRGWVTEVFVTEAADGTKSFKFGVLTPNGTSHNYNPPRIKMFGLDPNGVMIVQSLFNVAGAGSADSMKNALMPLMLMGGDDLDLGEIMPMLLFSGMNGGTGGDMSQMMTQMMMFKAMGLGGNKKSSGLGKSYFEGNGRRG